MMYITRIQNYTYDISQLFNYNAFVVISDNVERKHGCRLLITISLLHGNRLDGRNVDNNRANTMRTLIEGLFPKDRLLKSYSRNFIVFLEEGSTNYKNRRKISQFFGVNFAVNEAIRATSGGWRSENRG